MAGRRTLMATFRSPSRTPAYTAPKPPVPIFWPTFTLFWSINISSGKASTCERGAGAEGAGVGAGGCLVGAVSSSGRTGTLFTGRCEAKPGGGRAGWKMPRELK